MRPIKTMSFRGREFKVQEGTVHPAYSFFCFEADEADFREKYWHPGPGEVVVDVGASYGAYTLTALAMGAEVIAFEPEKTISVDLKANVDLNEFSNCTVYEKGLWDRSEDVDMRTYASHWPAHTISGPYEMRTLDDHIHSHVDWLKVDVEGAELHVLRGAAETLKADHPVVIVESHIFLDPTLTDRCKSILTACGYNAFEVVKRDPCEFLIAERHIIRG